jgi:hypothetical protein
MIPFPKCVKTINKSSITPHGIKIPRSTTQILIESLSHFEHTLDVLHSQRQLLIDRKGLRSANRVFNLRGVSREPDRISCGGAGIKAKDSPVYHSKYA